MLLAADHPERVAGIGRDRPGAADSAGRSARDAERAFKEPRDTDEGWAQVERHYWRRDYRGFIEFFIGQIFTEPHSTKQIEDAIGWALETDPETLVATQLAPRLPDEAEVRELVARIDCPMLVIHGRDDAVRPHASGEAFAADRGRRL